MITLHAATRGLISSNIPLGVSVDGLLYIPAIPVPPVYYGGGGDARRMTDWRAKRDREILEDDNEIFELIAVITPTLQ